MKSPLEIFNLVMDIICPRLMAEQFPQYQELKKFLLARRDNLVTDSGEEVHRAMWWYANQPPETQIAIEYGMTIGASIAFWAQERPLEVALYTEQSDKKLQEIYDNKVRPALTGAAEPVPQPLKETDDESNGSSGYLH